VRAALRALDLRPSRSMGQNFLIDPEALATIVAAAELTSADTVIEVGPGLGVLTWELVRRAGHVYAVELDKRLAARLREEFANAPLTIVQADVLRVVPGEVLGHGNTGTRGDEGRKTKDQSKGEEARDQESERIFHPSSFVLRPASARSPQPYKLVANLPYAITAPVLRHFLEAAAPPTLSVVLVQWEVAERITAQAGDLSVLAHSVQIYTEPEIVARVPARSFFPAPAVDSAILRMRRRPALAVPVDNVDNLFRVIKAGFLHTRKQLGNALPKGLAAMGFTTSREQAHAALAAAGVDPTRRAETLSLREWAALYEHLGVRGREA
jgi:16S rRNA (adenine1518-N6/adenine1519-N6)-dimethyltransferase